MSDPNRHTVESDLKMVEHWPELGRMLDEADAIVAQVMLERGVTNLMDLTAQDDAEIENRLKAHGWITLSEGEKS